MNTLRTLLFLAGFVILAGSTSCATATSDLPVRIISARESFVKLNASIAGIKLGEGSAVIIGKGEQGTHILTAKHICDKVADFEVVDIDFKKYKATVVKMSETADLCLMQTTEHMHRPAIVFAGKMPQPGEKVYNLAAPLGIHHYRMILQFEGYYSGRIFYSKLGQYLDLHTVPTKPGSSGSPTFNNRWELIGITSRAFGEIENVGMMATLDDIHCFLGLSANFRCPTVPKPAEGGASRLIPR